MYSDVLAYFKPITFDSKRFMKMRVKVMHDGLNRKRSYFGEEAINRAEASLRNVPILAFVESADGTNYEDFKGHEFKYEATEDGIKHRYLGRPIGIIPETNNYSYEEDEYGVKYVYVDAYVWKSYANEAKDILTRDGYKGVSMEILINNYQEHENDIVEILDYEYLGITLLGDHVMPGMAGAEAQMLTYSLEGVEDTMEDFKEKLTEDLQNTAPEVFEEVPAEVVTPEVAPEAPVEEAVETVVPEETTEVVEPIETPEEVNPIVEDQLPAAPVVEVATETKAETETETETNVPQMSEDLKVILEQLRSELENLRRELHSVKAENDELKNFKVSTEEAQFSAKLKEILENFSDLEEEEVNEILKDNKNLEDIEIRLFALRGKKATSPDTLKHFTVFDSLIKNSTNADKPSWASIVEENIKK